MTESDTNRLLIVGPEEGEAYRVSGHQIVIKAGASSHRWPLRIDRITAVGL
jgi:hypothetical protein